MEEKLSDDDEGVKSQTLLQKCLGSLALESNVLNSVVGLLTIFIISYSSTFPFLK